MNCRHDNSNKKKNSYSEQLKYVIFLFDSCF